MNSLFGSAPGSKAKYSRSRPRKQSKSKSDSSHVNGTYYVFGESDISDEEVVFETMDARSRTRDSKICGNKNTNNFKEVNSNIESIDNCCYNLKHFKDAPVNDWDVLNHQIQPNDSLQNLSIKYSIPVSEIKRINNLMKDQEFYALRSIKIPIRKHGILSELLNETKQNNDGCPAAPEDADKEGCAASFVRTINLGIGNKVNGIADKTSFSSFFQEMDEDLAKIRDYPKSYKDSLDEVASTLTCKRFKPLSSKSGSFYKCIDMEGSIRWKFLILIVVLFAIVIPVLFIYYYVKTGHSFLQS